MNALEIEEAVLPLSEKSSLSDVLPYPFLDAVSDEAKSKGIKVSPLSELSELI